MPWTGGDDDLRQLVRDLATLRQAIPSLRRGSFDEIASERGLALYDRRGGPDVAVIAINGDEPRSVEVPLANLGLGGGVLHRTLGPGASATIDGATLRMTLAPRAAGVVLLGAAGDAMFAPSVWWMVALTLTILAIAAAIIATRRRERPLRRV
jgi:hypothetical protein